MSDSFYFHDLLQILTLLQDDVIALICCEKCLFYRKCCLFLSCSPKKT